MPDKFHQSPHPFLATGAEGSDDLVIPETCGKSLARYRELSRVHSETGECATRPEHTQRILKCRLCSEGFDRHIDTSTARHALDLLDYITCGEIEDDICPHAFCHLGTHWIG